MSSGRLKKPTLIAAVIFLVLELSSVTFIVSKYAVAPAPMPVAAAAASHPTQFNETFLTLNLSYRVVGGGSPGTPPVLHFFQSGVQREATVSRYPEWTPFRVDAGTDWAIDPFLYGSAVTERWALPTSNMTGRALANKKFLFEYYHQFSLAAKYFVKLGGNLSSNPSLTVMQQNLPKVIELGAQSSLSGPIWADNESTWKADSQILAPTGAERWWNDNSTGIVTGSGLIAVTYLHQFLLTMKVDPLDAGGTIPSQNYWGNAGSEVSIQAIGNGGWAFQYWSCEKGGSTCYSGLENPAQIVMNGPIAETAHFRQGVNVALQINGSDVTQFIIVDANTTRVSPHGIVLSWPAGSAHTITALSNVSCGFSFMFFHGCQYEFKGWYVDGKFNGSTSLRVDVTADKPTTIVARWEKSYLQLEIAAIAAAAIVAILLVWNRRRPAKPSPKPPPTSPSAPAGLLYRVGCISDVGRVRTNNEDSILAMEMVTTFESNTTSIILSAVADGVGGSQKGEIASRITIETMAAKVFQPVIGSESPDLTKALRDSIEASNDAVVKYGMEHPESEGLATTIVASVIDGSTAHIGNAGDSRAYLVNRGGIKQLTKDHSQVQDFVDEGKISIEEARQYPGRNVITRAIGASADIRVDMYSISLAPGDRVLLCTDGLWEPVQNDEIHKIVMQSPDPQTASEKLVALANERGGKDNISIVIVELKGPADIAQS
jgi:serine/threonine protein phosphatase PrpC